MDSRLVQMSAGLPASWKWEAAMSAAQLPPDLGQEWRQWLGAAQQEEQSAELRYWALRSQGNGGELQAA